MKTICQRCKHEWEYTGQKGSQSYSEFVTCPKCFTKVRLNSIKRVEKVKGGNRE